jgi:cysteine synthase
LHCAATSSTASANTPIVPLSRIGARSGASVSLKLESDNPAGSMKDRMDVAAALRVAERLGPGSSVVTLMCDGGIKYLKRYGESL